MNGVDKKKPNVVPNATAIATPGEKNKAINNGTWEANVKDAGGIMILGITIGIITPIPINNAEIVSVRTEFFFIFPSPNMS